MLFSDSKSDVISRVITHYNLCAIVGHECGDIINKVGSLNERSVWWTINYRSKTWWMTYDIYFTEQILWFTGLTSPDTIRWSKNSRSDRIMDEKTNPTTILVTVTTQENIIVKVHYWTRI